MEQTVTVRGVLRQWWRVPVIGLLAGMVAFVGSFIVAPTYVSSTRVLIHGRESTILNSNGDSLSNQPGVLDSQLSTTLGATQAAMLGSRSVAEEIVDRLALDERTDDATGPVASLRRGFAISYKWTRAVLTAGFYKDPGKRKATIDNVQHGLSATPIEDSYVLEISAAFDDPEIAADIADTAAAILVESSITRFEQDANSYAEFLTEQASTAQIDRDAAVQSVEEFRESNGITSERTATLTQDEADRLAGELRQAGADLGGARTELSQVSSDLARTPAKSTNSTEIQTGRSTTNVDDQVDNPVYLQLLQRRNVLTGQVAGLQAKIAEIEDALSAEIDSRPKSAIEAELSSLELERDIAISKARQLSELAESAEVNAASRPAELSRLDVAVAPTYPAGPARYLFLGLGLVFGAALGFVWSFLRTQRRRDDDLHDDDTDEADDLREIDLVSAETAGSNGRKTPTVVLTD